MPRYVVTMCDVHTQEIHSWIKSAYTAQAAVLSHPWIAEVYLASWVYANLSKDSKELQETLDKILENLGYVTCVVNLDEEIMNDLNAGDSSVSSSQPAA